MSGYKEHMSLAEDVIRVAGADALDGLIRARGGQVVVMPTREWLEKMGAEHWLVAAVGMKAAIAIAGIFPIGQDVVVPLGRYSRQRMMGAQIRELLLSGSSSNAIAAAVGCHYRTVQNHRAKMRKEGFL